MSPGVMWRKLARPCDPADSGSDTIFMKLFEDFISIRSLLVWNIVWYWNISVVGEIGYLEQQFLRFTSFRKDRSWALGAFQYWFLANDAKIRSLIAMCVCLRVCGTVGFKRVNWFGCGLFKILNLFRDRTLKARFRCMSVCMAQLIISETK